MELLCTEENPYLEDRDSMEIKYFKMLSEYSRCIKHLTNIIQSNYFPSANVELPDIKISPFSGEITGFESFHQLLDALIIKNAS